LAKCRNDAQKLKQQGSLRPLGRLLRHFSQRNEQQRARRHRTTDLLSQTFVADPVLEP
jgi:hypothetical protein